MSPPTSFVWCASCAIFSAGKTSSTDRTFTPSCVWVIEKYVVSVLGVCNFPAQFVSTVLSFSINVYNNNGERPKLYTICASGAVLPKYCTLILFGTFVSVIRYAFGFISAIIARQIASIVCVCGM